MRWFDLPAASGRSSSSSRPVNGSAASNVQTLVIPGCGHWVAEQAPNDLLAGLAEFLDS